MPLAGGPRDLHAARHLVGGAVGGLLGRVGHLAA